MKVLLSTAYWPNLHYFFYVLRADEIIIEQFENYQKQSFRNRTQILSANRPLDLSIPVHKNGLKELVKDLHISYQENWQIRHWRAIISAYRNSPYFDYFEAEIEDFYLQPVSHLLDYNTKQLHLILKILKLKKNIQFSADYEHAPEHVIDLRNSIHPKLDLNSDLLAAHTLAKPYYQTFESKFAFAPNLSILDLLFNKGLEAVEYLLEK